MHSDIRYLVHYESGGTSRQVCWDDVLTHIALRRLAKFKLPTHITDLNHPGAERAYLLHRLRDSSLTEVPCPQCSVPSGSRCWDGGTHIARLRFADRPFI